MKTTLKHVCEREFSETAENILAQSSLLVGEDCMIVDGVVFEKLSPQERNNKRYARCMYRFFTDVDDYDYLEWGVASDIGDVIQALDGLWKLRVK